MTYTAAVSPATATGAMTFKEGGVAIPGCSKQAIAPGKATTCTTTYPAAGWHSMIAVYSGDNTYATSTSSTLTQVIHGDPTTVTLSSSLNPSTVGQAVTYTATVNPHGNRHGRIHELRQPDIWMHCADRERWPCEMHHDLLRCGRSLDQGGLSGDNTYATSTAPSLTQAIDKNVSTTVLASLQTPQ